MPPGIYPRPSIEERLWAKVVTVGDCQVWTGCTQKNGYGAINIGGKRVLVHRLSYSLYVGPLIEGLTIDHIRERCTSRACIRPDHLRQITRGENTLAGNTITATNAAKTHCPRGHPYTSENTVLDGGSRKCRTCRRERSSHRAAIAKAERHRLKGLAL